MKQKRRKGARKENYQQQVTKQYHELRMNTRRQDMKEWRETDHRQDLVDQSCKSKVLKQLSRWLDLVGKLNALMPDHGITWKQKQSLFLDYSVAIERETRGRVEKGRGQKHRMPVAANELKLLSSHIDCLVTQQVLLLLTKRKKHDSHRVCWINVFWPVNKQLSVSKRCELSEKGLYVF